MGRKEKANFTRICQLLIDKGGDALRRVLQSKIDTSPPPSTLDSFLKTNIKSLQKIRYRVISTAQWKLLFPAAGSADSNNFDITLLTILLRNICGLASPASGWDVMPPAGDNCSSAEILRIKLLRNKVYAHTTIAQYDDTTFETLWQAISEPLINLKIPKRDIDELKEAALSPEEESYIEALKEWKTLENSLISKFDDMENNLSSKFDDLAREFANKLRGEMSPNTVIQESSRGNAAVEVTSRAVQTDPELTRQGGNILFNIATDNVQVPRELGGFGIGLVREFCHIDFQLGAIWTVCHLVRPLLRAATRYAFDDDRDGHDDQETGEPSVGSLHVLVRCFTDERFLEVLADYESGEVKRRLQKELTDVGLKVEGLRVEIENLEEVSRKKTSIIKKRYVMDSLNQEEMENLTRLTKLLVDKGAQALRNTFNDFHPPAKLPAVLNANRTFLWKKLKLSAISDQLDLLFPSSGTPPPDSKTFDVRLLTFLLHNICDLPHPSTGWDTMPPDSDRSTEANIARIKLFRNQVRPHAVSGQVDNATFEELWKNVTQALVELKIPRKEIDDLKRCPLAPEEKVYVQMLKDWDFFENKQMGYLALIKPYAQHLQGDRHASRAKLEPKSKKPKKETPVSWKWEERSIVHRQTFINLLEYAKTHPKEIKEVNGVRVCCSKEFLIGKGSDGTRVYVGLGNDGVEKAVKRLDRDSCSSLAEQEKKILNQLNTVKSKHVVNYWFLDDQSDKNYLFLILDLCEETLEHFVESSSETDLVACAPDVIEQVLKGLVDLHRDPEPILHRDLKPSNILRNVQNNWLLADFGISHILDTGDRTYVTMPRGSEDWKAVESYSSEAMTNDSNSSNVRHMKESDIQVAGMVAFYTVTKGGHPFGETPDRLRNLLDGKPVGLDTLKDEAAKDLIAWMLKHDPKDRPSAKEALKHPYLQPPKQQFEMLCKVGNQQEIKTGDNNSPVVQNLNKDLTDWRTLMTPDVLEYLCTDFINGKPKVFSYKSSWTECLRLIRNVNQHWHDRPRPRPQPEAFYQVGDPETFFLNLYPSLPVKLHRIIRSCDWKERHDLKEYFI